MKKTIKMNTDMKNKIKGIGNIMEYTLYDLFWRWECRTKYEDWNDYIEVMKQEFHKLTKDNYAKTAVFVKGNRYPFGLTFDFNGWRIDLIMNRTHYTKKMNKI